MNIRVFFLVIITIASATAAAEEFERQIIHYADNLYVFRILEFHQSVFLVTPEGAIVIDPIRPEGARWLKEEIKARFDIPVRYVVYSHGHGDHISGSIEFQDEAVFVAHENAKKWIVDRTEEDLVDLIAVPDITFTDKLSLQLGGEQVDLVYLKPASHPAGLIVAIFPKYGVLYDTDTINSGTIAYRDFPTSEFPEIIDTLEYVETLEFEHLIDGHLPGVFPRSEIRVLIDYFRTLRTNVQEAIDNGLTVEQALDTVPPKMEVFHDRQFFEKMIELNVEGAYRCLLVGCKR